MRVRTALYVASASFVAIRCGFGRAGGGLGWASWTAATTTSMLNNSCVGELVARANGRKGIFLQLMPSE